jgi:hypothetical protein
VHKMMNAGLWFGKESVGSPVGMWDWGRWPGPTEGPIPLIQQGESNPPSEWSRSGGSCTGGCRELEWPQDHLPWGQIQRGRIWLLPFLPMVRSWSYSAHGCARSDSGLVRIYIPGMESHNIPGIFLHSGSHRFALTHSNYQVHMEYLLCAKLCKVGGPQKGMKSHGRCVKTAQSAQSG